jgi:hypothetical protein
MCPQATATIPPTTGHKNQETIPKTSEATALPLVGDWYIITVVAYWGWAYGGEADRGASCWLDGPLL